MASSPPAPAPQAGGPGAQTERWPFPPTGRALKHWSAHLGSRLRGFPKQRRPGVVPHTLLPPRYIVCSQGTDSMNSFSCWLERGQQLRPEASNQMVRPGLPSRWPPSVLCRDSPVATRLPTALLPPHPVSPHERQSAPSGASFHPPCPHLVLVLRALVSGASPWAQQTSDHCLHPPVSSSAHS